MPFGLKCKSSKEKEKKAAEREKRALMWEFGREASPKDRLVKEGRDIAAEHDSHAQNGKSPGFHVAEAHVRENLCFELFGGGDVPSATIVREILSSPKNNACLQRKPFGLLP